MRGRGSGGMTAGGGGMTAGGGGMTAGRIMRGRRRRGRGFLGGRLRRGRGFFDTVKRIGKKVFNVIRDPRTMALAKQGYDIYRSAKGVRRRRLGGAIRKIKYRKMLGRGMAYNSMATAGPLP